jgi:lipopolysaccharide/colanic/teichoic acid biosynthesis glycosyltransferase
MRGARAFAIQETAFEETLRRPYWRLKRVLDATVALALIVLLMPLIFLTALVVAFDVGLPVLFMQQRPGHRGSRFTLYKFRTMGPSHDAAGLRTPDDARVSRVGKFMRRTRLDELPQLFNILVGDMSFVGPRPLVTREQSPEIVARLLVRPGLTGWAQVYGGRAVSVEDKVALDLWYVRHASFLLDLRIMAATVPMVIFGEHVNGGIVRLAWQDLHELRGRAVRE